MQGAIDDGKDTEDTLTLLDHPIIGSMEYRIDGEQLSSTEDTDRTESDSVGLLGYMIAI
jgi:hypothetical protein